MNMHQYVRHPPIKDMRAHFFVKVVPDMTVAVDKDSMSDRIYGAF